MTMSDADGQPTWQPACEVATLMTTIAPSFAWASGASASVAEDFPAGMMMLPDSF